MSKKDKQNFIDKLLDKDWFIIFIVSIFLVDTCFIFYMGIWKDSLFYKSFASIIFLLWLSHFISKFYFYYWRR